MTILTAKEEGLNKQFKLKYFKAKGEDRIEFL